MRPFRRQASPPRVRTGAAGRVVPGTAGVLIARDAIDVLPLVVAHHLRIGVERIHVIDDGSSDGSWELLGRLSRRTWRVTHHRELTDDDPQLEAVSDAANRLIAHGARLVLPFDADELWDATPDRLESWVRDERPRRLIAQWANFAQARHHVHPRPGGLLDVRFRAPIDPGATHDAVTAFRASFLQHGPVRKVAVWSRAPVAFSRGQHDVRLVGEADALEAVPAGTDVLHVPLRWQSELTKRALNYEPRRARRRAGSGESWQSLFHLAVVREGRDDLVWAATSVDEGGHLDVFGTAVPLVPDDRVHDAVRLASRFLDAMGLPVP